MIFFQPRFVPEERNGYKVERNLPIKKIYIEKVYI